MPDYSQALQPIAGSKHDASASTKILKDLAPQLFHPRITGSNAFVSAVTGGSSSSSSGRRAVGNGSTSSSLELSNPNNAWISLARSLRAAQLLPQGPRQGDGRSNRNGKAPVTSTDLRIIEGVQRLLDLPLPTVEEEQEEGEEHGHDHDDDASYSFLSDSEDAASTSRRISASRRPVGLLEGFKATIPSASSRKTARRRRRAGISERQLGIQAGISELGLKERGDRARGLLSTSEWTVDSIESTPKRRTIKGKRRSSYMPTAGSRNDSGDETEELTRPELEAEVKEIGLDKQALKVRRRLVLKDLQEVEMKIRKLEDVREELGTRLLRLKEEELELDDELEGVKDRLTALEARSSGRIVSGTSSRRRRGPAFLPSEHDDLPPNVAFMTLVPASTSPLPTASSASYPMHPSHSSGPLSSITSLDFSEPYGTLVASSSEPDKGVRVYDLSTGEQASSLVGHRGVVKTLLVEGSLCVTGGADGRIVLWDLPTSLEEGEELLDQQHQERNRYVGAGRQQTFDDERDDPFFTPPRHKAGKGAAEHSDGEDGEDAADSGLLAQSGDGFSRSKLRILEGHSKDVTCLSYEDASLVSGSSDKTLRLWDLNTGQCVVTMDILWAISNPLPVEVEDTQPASHDSLGLPTGGNRRHTIAPGSLPVMSPGGLPTSPARGVDGEYPWSVSSPSTSAAYMTPNRKRTSLSGLRRLSSQYGNLSSLASPGTPSGQLSSFSFAQATPPYSDGSWEMYSDFVGGVQLWSYALASGSADGCVRMWDTRTGQSVRSLVGHTGAITSLQFDNTHLISGSLDKSVRIWDLRTGKTIDVLKYEGPVTDLQFDSRRILVAGGTNTIQVFNRTTLQQTELIMNCHTSPAEKLRFMDKYLATGGRDATVKIWSLA